MTTRPCTGCVASFPHVHERCIDGRRRQCVSSRLADRSERQAAVFKYRAEVSAGISVAVAIECAAVKVGERR